MSWATPTITHTRGRLVRHTYITAVGTMEGTTDVTTTLTIPTAVFAGIVQARSDGGTATDTSRITIRTGTDTIGASPNETNIYSHTISLATDPDYWPIRSLFEEISAPTNANSIGDITLPTNELFLFIESNNAAQTTETVTIFIGLLSHVLEV